MVSQDSVSKDFREQLEGYGLTTANILYRRPDHPWLLQSYVWQSYDLCPVFPKLNKFLNFWLEKLEGPLHSVTVAHARLIKPAEIRAIDGEFRLHCFASLAMTGEAVYGVITPTIAPNRHVVSVPETIDLRPSETTSSRRSGHMVESPAIMMPSDPKLAKPHIA